MNNKTNNGPFTEKAVTKDRHGNIGFKLINSFDYDRYTGNHDNYTAFNPYKPSVSSECIFADMFLYSMAFPTKILNVPILYSAGIGVNSSSHQLHVPFHAHGFSKIDMIQNGMINGLYKIPSFLMGEKFQNKLASSDLPRYSEKATNWTHLISTTEEYRLALKHKGVPARFSSLEDM